MTITKMETILIITWGALFALSIYNITQYFRLYKLRNRFLKLISEYDKLYKESLEREKAALQIIYSERGLFEKQTAEMSDLFDKQIKIWKTIERGYQNKIKELQKQLNNNKDEN